jgi:DNA-binding NtrC family response regulator
VKKATKIQPPRPRPIVIVDDEKSYVELLAATMADNMECVIHAFTRPSDALAYLAKGRPGVIVTDYFMPEMDGIEFIRKAGKLAPGAVFVMISGHNLEPMAHELDRLKRLKERLQKPFGWKTLADAVLRVWPGGDRPGFRP